MEINHITEMIFIEWMNEFVQGHTYLDIPEFLCHAKLLGLYTCQFFFKKSIEY